MTARITFTHQGYRARPSRIDPFCFAMLDSFDPRTSSYFLKIGELHCFDNPIPISERFVVGNYLPLRPAPIQKLSVSKHDGNAWFLLLPPHVGDIASRNKEEQEEKRGLSLKQLRPHRSNDYTEAEHGNFEDTRLPPLERKILENVHLTLPQDNWLSLWRGSR